jgi:gliding motility-associated-like protein
VTSTGNTATVSVPTDVAGSFDYEVISVEDASTTVCTQNQTETATVLVNPLPTATIAGDITLCQNESQPTITFTGADGTAPYTFTYSINGGTAQTVTSTGNTATVQVPTGVVGSFDYELLSLEGGSGSACSQNQKGTVTVTINISPSASFTADPMLTDLGSTEVNFTNTSSNATDYTWDFGDNSPFSYDENPTHFFPDNTPNNYTVILFTETNEGCADSTSVMIVIEYPPIVYKVPNVFTPNGDGDNDFFKMIKAAYIDGLEIVILNRWGDIVFESSEVNFKWNGLKHNNGVECTDGTYFYKLKLKRITGKDYNEHGFVQLSRGK